MTDAVGEILILMQQKPSATVQRCKAAFDGGLIAKKIPQVRCMFKNASRSSLAADLSSVRALSTTSNRAPYGDRTPASVHVH
jgi:hypothetical protein